MRGKEPVSNWGPGDEEDEELVWERLRARQASDAAPAPRARSEVVPRTRIAGEPQNARDPYASYAQQVQNTSETPAYGVSPVQAAYEEAEELEGELQEDDEDEDEEAIWERLRGRNAPEQRVSDIGALGSHQAYQEEEPEAEEYEQQQAAYAQQQYEQEQQAYAQQQYEQEQQAYARQQYEQQQAYAQQQYEQQAYAYAQQQEEEQQEAFAQQQYEQAMARRQQQEHEQQAYAQQQYEQQQQAYAQPEYEQQDYAQQQYEQQHAYEQAFAQQQAYEQQMFAQQQEAYGQPQQYEQQDYAQQQGLFGQQPYAPSGYMRESHQADPFSPLPASHAPQAAAPQQQHMPRAAMDPTWTGDDDSYAPKRSKKGLVVTLVAGIVLAAGGGVAMRYVQHAAPTLQSSSGVSAAGMAAPAAEPALGADEMRARDAVFGTHTAPPAPAPTTVSAPAPEPVVAAAAPSALPSSTPSLLPSSSPAEKSAPAPKGKAAKAKKGKAAKAKPAAKIAKAAPKAAPKKAPREKPDQSGLGGVSKRSNDPLDGI